MASLDHVDPVHPVSDNIRPKQANVWGVKNEYNSKQNISPKMSVLILVPTCQTLLNFFILFRGSRDGGGVKASGEEETAILRSESAQKKCYQAIDVAWSFRQDIFLNLDPLKRHNENSFTRSISASLTGNGSGNQTPGEEAAATHPFS